MELQDDEAVLLEDATRAEIDLAKNLLEVAGIPSVVAGHHYDVAELAAHNVFRGRGLIVPRAMLEQARAVLKQAWGEFG